MGQKTTLVGESFAPWVKDQVEARQNLLGRRAGQSPRGAATNCFTMSLPTLYPSIQGWSGTTT